MTTSLLNPLKEIALQILLSKKNYNYVNFCIVIWLIDQQEEWEDHRIGNAGIKYANHITMETLNDLKLNDGYVGDYYEINNFLKKARIINRDLSEEYLSNLAKYILGCLKWIKAAA